jgi:hypothetical protein
VNLANVWANVDNFFNFLSKSNVKSAQFEFNLMLSKFSN